MLANDKLKRMKLINTYILILILILIIIITLLLMYKYSVEGEANMPFNLAKINIISTVVSGEEISKEEGTWTSQLSQNNNIYFYIEKNQNYKKQDTIKKIVFNNFVLTAKNDSDIRIYRPSKPNNLYDYKEEFIVNENLEYVGAQNTDTEILQINNQGGIIGFSVVNYNLTQYILEGDSSIGLDGTLLKNLGIDIEDIKFNLSFEMTIETNIGNKFMAPITLELPIGDITETGINSKEDTELKNIVFKRCK